MMAAKIWLEIQRRDGIETRDVRPNPETADNAIVDGACPSCACEPFYVKGTHPRRMPDDRTLRSGGYCLHCGDPVGWIYAQPDTLFGLEEDDRVLHGRCRVY